MARFVMANRRAGKFLDETKRVARADVDTAVHRLKSEISILKDFAPQDETARRVVVFEADPAAMNVRMATLPQDVLLEPEILHYPAATFLREHLHLQNEPSAASALLGTGLEFKLTLTGGDRPLSHARVVFFLRSTGNITAKNKVQADGDGVASIDLSPTWQISAAIVIPVGNFWVTVVRGPSNGAKVACEPLPANGPLGWWHNMLGEEQWQPGRGNGIKVGVIDTGVGPHRDLAHVVDVGAFINGSFDPAGGADVDSHGSHVCGTIGARAGARGFLRRHIPWCGTLLRPGLSS